MKLKTDRNLQVIVDVIASRETIPGQYPTQAVEIVAEILSYDDAMSRVLAKCRLYEEWKFREI